MKKKHIIIILILICMNFSACESIDKTSTTTNTKYSAEELLQTEQANKKMGHYLNVKVSDIKLENGYFTGTVQNTNNDVAVESLTLDIAIYNTENNKIGDEYIYINRINCNETYEINQKFYDYKYKNASSFKLVDKKIIFDE